MRRWRARSGKRRWRCKFGFELNFADLENFLTFQHFQEARLKAEERERKKAEVRKRLEEAGSKKKAKKGFLTPERKKKLRVSFFGGFR